MWAINKYKKRHGSKALKTAVVKKKENKQWMASSITDASVSRRQAKKIKFKSRSYRIKDYRLADYNVFVHIVIEILVLGNTDFDSVES